MLDVRSGAVLRTVKVGPNPARAVVDGTTARLFVVNTNSGCVPAAPSLWDRLPAGARHALP